MSGGGGLGDFINAQDMFDGGGAGMAGAEFEGGAISPLLNQLGIKPAGYRDRMQPQRPQMRPPMGQPMGVPAPAPVQTTPLAPQMPQVNAAPPGAVPGPMPGAQVNSMVQTHNQIMQEQDPISRYYMMIEAQQRGLLK